ncbi:MAG: hypothetical protein ACREIR_25465 [Geminicoccaceae bacterium]
MTGVDAAAVLNRLKTGDLVLFTGHGLASSLRKWFSRSPWTHVGLVLRAPDAAEPLLWEAGRAGPRRGALVVRLAVRIAEFPGRIGVRCLNRALAAAQCDRLEALRREVAGRAARRGLLDLMGAADDGWLGARPEILGDPTDGELVAEAYQRLGLLDDLAPANGYRPWQFAERYGLELKQGYALGPEMMLSDPGQALGWGGASAQAA